MRVCPRIHMVSDHVVVVLWAEGVVATTAAASSSSTSSSQEGCVLLSFSMHAHGPVTNSRREFKSLHGLSWRASCKVWGGRGRVGYGRGGSTSSWYRLYTRWCNSCISKSSISSRLMRGYSVWFGRARSISSPRHVRDSAPRRGACCWRLLDPSQAPPTSRLADLLVAIGRVTRGQWRGGQEGTGGTSSILGNIYLQTAADFYI